MTVEPPAGGGERTPTSFERSPGPLGRCVRDEGGESASGKPFHRVSQATKRV